MSVSVGAFAVTLPVAAHMPGGGVASMALILAVLRRLPTEVSEAFVEVRERFVGVACVASAFTVAIAIASGVCVESSSGLGKGTGVRMSSGEEGIAGHVLSPNREFPEQNPKSQRLLEARRPAPQICTIYLGMYLYAGRRMAQAIRGYANTRPCVCGTTASPDVPDVARYLAASRAARA